MILEGVASRGSPHWRRAELRLDFLVAPGASGRNQPPSLGAATCGMDIGLYDAGTLKHVMS